MKDASAKEVCKLILSSALKALNYWSRANCVLKVHETLVKVLRLVDGVMEMMSQQWGTYTRQWIRQNFLSGIIADTIKGIRTTLTKDETSTYPQIYSHQVKSYFNDIVF